MVDMIEFIFILSLLCLWAIVAILEKYGSNILAAMKQIWQMALPKNAGIIRLCLVLSITLSIVSLIEIPKYSGMAQIVCGKGSCHIFGEPSWTTVTIIFCVPFVVAKVIEFIIEGFRR